MTCTMQVVSASFEVSPTTAKGNQRGYIRSTQVVGAGAPRRRAVHGRPGHRDRERRAALDPGRPRVLTGEPAMGDQRLRAGLRRLPPPRGTSCRPPRSAEDLPRRPCGLLARLASGGFRVVRGIADLGARAPGT